MTLTSQYGTYDLLLVGLSYVISVLGSFTALRLARQLRGSTADDRWTWLGLSAVAMGGVAIWSMHFIGMLAFDPGMPVSYDVGVTLLSLVISILVTGLGLFLTGGRTLALGRLLVSGTLMGVGVASMHYTGMAAMRMNMAIRYDTTLVVASVLIAVTASTVALWLAFSLHRTWHVIGAGFVMGIAVCGMHYTAMAAAIFGPGATAVLIDPQAISPVLLAYGVFTVSVVVLSASLVIVSSHTQNQQLA